MTHPERPDRTPITSPRSDRVRTIAGLAGRSARRRSGIFRVEGPQAVRSLLAERADLARELFLTERGAVEHPELAELAAAAGIPRSVVADEILAAMVPAEEGGMVTPQGALALAAIPGLGIEPALAGLPAHGPWTVVVLEEVRDPGNVGTLVRTADAAGADLVVLTVGCADPWAPKAARASAGSIFHLPVATGVDGDRTAALLREHGVAVLATSGGAEAELFDAALPTRLAWWFGNEARGLSAERIADSDLAVRIPLAGRAESLNVQAAATVCLFETLRRRGRG